MPGPELTHLDAAGNARMVDVTAKRPTRRRAVARALLRMSPDTARRVLGGELPTGDVLGAARTAAVLAAKRTDELVPLCHPLLLGEVAVEFGPAEHGVGIEAAVDALDRTGVEMEALTACAVAALTVYQACRHLDDTLVLDDLAVWHKTGGRSGAWLRRADGTVARDGQPGCADPADATATEG
ncbi:MAG TPA: cyclic pyranopterin monophosphate synthase MoaC [Acidimicrobiales bacterium]|jgi:cyclic pyranopterin phosphate synthase|nr:cyclic pyranopterin monophosphate synthase MoaC [Acidimicrobiales bacterium]